MKRSSAAALTLCLALIAPTVALRAGEPAPKAIATPKVEPATLNAADREALKKLFEQLSQAFLKDDADECLKLFAPSAAERNKLVENIRDEFTQSHYDRFEIVELRTSEIEQDIDRKHVYTVDVVLKMETAIKQPGGERTDEKRVYTTAYSFVVQRMNDGTFLLRYSEFFKTLGLRRGPGLLLQGVGVLMGFCAALLFYVWMGWEAWRERPRAKFWRIFVVVLPLAGSLVYFVFRLIPRWVKKN